VRRRVLVLVALLVVSAAFWAALRFRPRPAVSPEARRTIGAVRDTSAENRGAKTRGMYERDRKQRGVNLVAGRRTGEEILVPLLRDNVEWISLGPFGWQEGARDTTILVHGEGGFYSERDSGVVELTTRAHDLGMRVMLKPQLWLMRGGGSLGEVDPGTPERWAAWFASYRQFLLHYARLASAAQVDLFCVGAELSRAASHAEAWRSLIADVRRVYRGPLTYAANWNGEVEEIAFWDDLDYIGVQAYYPLCQSSLPSVAALVRGYAPVAASLERISRRHGRPVLFTEVGWKSTADAAVRPWEWTEDLSEERARISLATQANAYEAFFHTFWDRPWFAGAYVWKWYARHDRAGGTEDFDFTPQNKPAEAVLARGFGSEGAVVSGAPPPDAP